MAFDIKFIESVSKDIEREAEIVIGNFSERLLIPTTYWKASDYQNQWHSAVNSLLFPDSKDAAALITAMYDPKGANFIVLWVLYRDAEIVHIQNRLLFMEEVQGLFKLDKLQDYIGHRIEVNENGEKISEWTCSIADLEEFRDNLQIKH